MQPLWLNLWCIGWLKSKNLIEIFVKQFEDLSDVFTLFSHFKMSKYNRNGTLLKQMFSHRQNDANQNTPKCFRKSQTWNITNGNLLTSYPKTMWSRWWIPTSRIYKRGCSLPSTHCSTLHDTYKNWQIFVVNGEE